MQSNTEEKLWRLTIDTNPEDCNLRCIMCEEHSPYSQFIDNLYKNTKIKRRVLSSNWLEKIFVQAKELGIREIIPSTMGEPLLYKHFEDILRLCSEYKIKLNLTTNGTFPKRSASEWAKMIVPITSDVKISWNGASKATAETVMSGINFDKAIQNVKDFVQIRDEVFNESNYYCRVTFQLTFMENNMHELSEIIQLASKLGIDRVKGHHLWTHFKEIENLSFRRNPDSIHRWNQYVKDAYNAQARYLGKNGKMVLLENIVPLQLLDNTEVPINYKCPFLNRELWISATGQISPCCAPDEQRKSLGDFGNIQTNSLSDTFNSEGYQKLVKEYYNHPLCRTCTMRKINLKI